MPLHLAAPAALRPTHKCRTVFAPSRPPAGWDLGVATMKQGEVSKLTIQADYGYGASGSPPTIPGGATLVRRCGCAGQGVGGGGVLRCLPRLKAAAAGGCRGPAAGRVPAPAGSLNARCTVKCCSAPLSAPHTADL